MKTTWYHSYKVNRIRIFTNNKGITLRFYTENEDFQGSASESKETFQGEQSKEFKLSWHVL